MNEEQKTVNVDAAIYRKLIAESLARCGYRVGDTFVEVTKGLERAWIIELRFEVER